MLRFHCTLHKCLTVLFSDVFRNAFDRRGFLGSSFGNFARKDPEEFVQNGHKHTLSLINTAFVDPGLFDQDWRGSLAIRDPRDMIVSGYFYHKKGHEGWTRQVAPNPQWCHDLSSGKKAFPEGQSLMEYLNEAKIEDCLIAEIELRKKTFDTITSWKRLNDPRMRIIRYEDILGHERGTFRSLGKHYELGKVRQEILGHYGFKHSAAKLSSRKHIRDPSPRQWQKFFTPAVERFFHESYPGLVQELGYDP